MIRCGLEPEALVALLQAAQLNRGLGTGTLRLDVCANPLGLLGGRMLQASTTPALAPTLAPALALPLALAAAPALALPQAPARALPLPLPRRHRP